MVNPTPNLSAGRIENGLRKVGSATWSLFFVFTGARASTRAAANPASIIAAKAGIAAIASVGLITATSSSIRGNSLELAISDERAADAAVFGSSATAREIPAV